MKKFLLAIALMFGTATHAQILVDESLIKPPSGLSVGGSLGFSKVEYKYDDDYTFDLDRKTLGLGLVSNLGGNVNLLFQAGYTFESEYEDTDWKGKGWMLGGGVNFLFHRGAKVDFIGYGLLNYIQEEYKWRKRLTADLTMMDLHLGGLVMFKASPRVGLYIGPDFVPYSDGEIKFSDKHHGEDIQRDDIFNLKVGASIVGDGVIFRPEITFMNEQTIMLTVDF